MTNQELIDKYPWLRVSNRWTGKFVEDADWTELDDMPHGWRIAFGEEMCEELNQEIVTWPLSAQENFRITQIKEKYGHLCFYTNGESKRFREIVGKYTIKSKTTCIYCGKPAHWISRGWISPLCDDCAHENFEHLNGSYSAQTPWEEEYIDIKEYYKPYKEED